MSDYLEPLVVAQNIYDAVCSYQPGSGFAVFDVRDGSGGAWYSSNSTPHLGPFDIATPIPWYVEGFIQDIESQIAYRQRNLP